MFIPHSLPVQHGTKPEAETSFATNCFFINWFDPWLQPQTLPLPQPPLSFTGLWPPTPAFQIHCDTLMGITLEQADQYKLEYATVKALKSKMVSKCYLSVSVWKDRYNQNICISLNNPHT